MFLPQNHQKPNTTSLPLKTAPENVPLPNPTPQHPLKRTEEQEQEKKRV